MQVDGGDARTGELLGELLGPVLGAREQHRAPHSARQLVHDRGLVRVIDRHHVVGHRRDRGLDGIDGVGDGVVQELLHQHVDATVEGRREQQPLCPLGRLAEDARDGRKETEVGHVVGLVEDGDADLVESAVALLHEVLQPTGGGDDDVDAGLQRPHLVALAHAPEDHRGAQGQFLGERGDDGEHLVGELAGRHQDEAARGSRLRAALLSGQARDERQAEGESLAGAGAAPAQDIAAGEAVGQRRRLDGEGCVDAAGSEVADQRGGDAAGGEGVARSGRQCGGAHDEESFEMMGLASGEP